MGSAQTAGVRRNIFCINGRQHVGRRRIVKMKLETGSNSFFFQMLRISLTSWFFAMRTSVYVLPRVYCDRAQYRKKEMDSIIQLDHAPQALSLFRFSRLNLYICLHQTVIYLRLMGEVAGEFVKRLCDSLYRPFSPLPSL